MTYWISRDILGQPPLRVEHEGPPPCLWCGEPVTNPSMDGPLVCGPCDSNGGAFTIGYADGRVERVGTPRITPAHREHFRYCIDTIVASQPYGHYPLDAGPGWFTEERKALVDLPIPPSTFSIDVRWGKETP